jgi:hypothetical protein
MGARAPIGHGWPAVYLDFEATRYDKEYVVVGISLAYKFNSGGNLQEFTHLDKCFEVRNIPKDRFFS